MAQEENLPIPLPDVPDSGLQADYEYAHQNVRDAIEIATAALQSMAAIADQSQHPKAYDTLGKLLDSVVKANREFLEIRGVKKSLEPPETKDSPQKIDVHNALFVTTADLQRLLTDARKSGDRVIEHGDARPLREGAGVPGEEGPDEDVDLR